MNKLTSGTPEELTKKALILGIISVALPTAISILSSILGWIPVLGWILMILGILAPIATLVCGILTIKLTSQIKKMGYTDTKVTIALVLGIIGIVLSAVSLACSACSCVSLCGLGALGAAAGM